MGRGRGGSGRRSVALGAAAVLALTCSAAACTSAEEKCKAARSAAGTAWSSYAKALQADVASETKTLAEAKLKLEDDIDLRLAVKAKRAATRMHDPGTMEWHRTYTAHYKAACSQDEECAQVRMVQREAEAKLAGLGASLKATKAIVAATGGPVGGMLEAMATLEEDFDHAEYKPAAAAAEVARDACAGQ